MDNTKKIEKGFWLTLAFAVIIVILTGVAFLPSVIESRETSRAATVSSEVDAEAMRVLGCCNAYAAANDFTTTMTGTVKAKVVGVPYTQKIQGGRNVSRDGDVTEVAESSSALVKAALKRERRDGKYYVSRGDYKNKAFRYNNEKSLSEKQYSAQYGQPFTGIVKYAMDNAVISATVIGDNVYKFVLDPAQSTLYSRNEVKTTLGSKSYPKYSRVEFTLTTDGDRPVKVTSVEKFRVDKFGGTNCTAEYTETFHFNSEL